MLAESGELVSSLQNKLKNLRSEFIDEKNTLTKEKKELEEANSSLKNQLSNVKAEEKALKERLAQVEEDERLSELEKRLQEEKEENSKLNKSLQEQQGVIKAALNRLYPNLGVELCQEHQEWLDKFVDKMKQEKTQTESSTD
jgi:predicted RNase H-like nuclease (RuvC/YqgF family)